MAASFRCGGDGDRRGGRRPILPSGAGPAPLRRVFARVFEPRRSGRRDVLTGLHVPRPVADVIVAFAAGGSWGVDLFFALSSFLITTILLRERQQVGDVDVASFYLRRVLRIWPLYFTLLLVVLPLVRPVSPADGMSGKYLVAFLLFVGNWACVWWGYPPAIAGQLWSVSIEEQFYLSWPWVLRRWADHLIVAACVLLAVAFAARALAGASRRGSSANLV